MSDDSPAALRQRLPSYHTNNGYRFLKYFQVSLYRLKYIHPEPPYCHQTDKSSYIRQAVYRNNASERPISRILSNDSMTTHWHIEDISMVPQASAEAEAMELHPLLNG